MIREIVNLPHPHTGQKFVRTHAKRFNFLSAGRRWRKTTLVMAIAVEAAYKQDHRVIWGAPTYDQVRVGWEETRRAANDVAKFNQATMTATFPGGGSILYRSLDNPDNARGHTADDVMIDEAADVAERAWYEVLRPMLLDTGGGAWIVGTPKGRNWFWREFVAAQERDDSQAWNAPTLGCEIIDERLIRKPHLLENPQISFDELLQMFRTLPERTFRQEIVGEFIEESGGVFRKIRDAIDPGRVDPTPPRPGDHYVIGVDLARVEDFSVVTILDGNGHQMFHERFNLISWERQIESIKSVVARYPGRVVIDSTGVGDPICEQLRRAGIDLYPYHFSNTSKEEAIDRLALLLEQGRLRLMDIDAQTNELLAFQYELTPSRNVRMAAPEGMHDDCVIALALAAFGMERYAWVAPTEAEIKAKEEADRVAAEAERERIYNPENEIWWGGSDDF